MKRTFKSLKKLLVELIKDERGIGESSDSLLLTFGGVIVASVVCTAIAVMLTGENKDGKGGVTGNISNQITEIMNDMVNSNNGN